MEKKIIKSKENYDLISVIVPIYNSAKYVKKCIKSIQNQTYKNLEIILIDDGSTDSSLQICNECSKEDKRIKVFFHKNRGSSFTRNFGIDVSSGKYITFIDSDDYVENKMIENLYKSIKKYNCDISIENTNINKKILKNIVIIDGKDNILEELFLERYFWAVLHGKMFKREIVENKRFDITMKISEDLKFLYEILKNTSRIIVIPEKEYNYLIRTDSISHSNFTYEVWNDEFRFMEKLIEEYDTKKLKPYLINRYMRIITNVIINFNLSPNDLKKLKTKMSKFILMFIFSFRYSIKEKIKVIFCYNFYYLKPIYLILKNINKKTKEDEK